MKRSGQGETEPSESKYLVGNSLKRNLDNQKEKRGKERKVRHFRKSQIKKVQNIVESFQSPSKP